MNFNELLNRIIYLLAQHPEPPNWQIYIAFIFFFNLWHICMHNLQWEVNIFFRLSGLLYTHVYIYICMPFILLFEFICLRNYQCSMFTLEKCRVHRRLTPLCAWHGCRKRCLFVVTTFLLKTASLVL